MTLNHIAATTPPRRRPLPRIILASASPRRRELLTLHGYDFQASPATITEVFPPHLAVAEIALFNARLKADAIAASEPDALILAADTLVALGQEIFGKPKDHRDAVRMLSALSGRIHCVYSGVWLRRGAQCCGFIDKSRVKFRKLSLPQIQEYFRRVNPLDKAGAYAAQEEGTRIITRIDGSTTNVIGLPMEKLERALSLFEITTSSLRRDRRGPKTASSF